MPTVGENIVNRGADLPPGVPAGAMGTAPGRITVDRSAPVMSKLSQLLQAAHDRTASLFGAAKPAVLPSAPFTPTLPPQAGAMRTASLEGGLDALQQRSTQLTPPVAVAPVNPPPPIPAPTPPAAGGSPAFDYRAYLQQNAIRDTVAKK